MMHTGLPPSRIGTQRRGPTAPRQSSLAAMLIDHNDQLTPSQQPETALSSQQMLTGLSTEAEPQDLTLKYLPQLPVVLLNQYQGELCKHRMGRNFCGTI